MTLSLEQRIQKLEDTEAIRRLKGYYCKYVDGGWDKKTHDGDSLATLFTEDAVMEFVNDPSGGRGARYEGREAIRTNINKASLASYASHNMCGELIEVNGDTATGIWHAMNYLTWPHASYVTTIIYHEDYIRTAEGWKISNLRALCRGIHPLDTIKSW